MTVKSPPFAPDSYLWTFRSDGGFLLFSLTGGTIVVACFAFIVNFPEQVLVVCELFFVHSTHLATGGLLLHLALKEGLVLPIDVRDLISEAFLLELVIILVGLPNHGLLVVERLFSLLAPLLLRHLACEELAHLILLEAVTLHATLILYASTHLPLLLVALESFLLGSDAALLLRDDIAGERVHKVLGAGLTCTELSQTVILLLVKHLAVLDLGVNIGTNLCLALF